MKILPPTLRNKKRYIVFETISEEPITVYELKKELFESSASLIGDAGTSACNLRLLDLNGKYGILRCSADKVWESRAVLAAMRDFKGKRIGIRVCGISGTVKGAKEKFVKDEDQ